MKVLFFDIDGTLLDHEGKVPQSTKEALLLAKGQGHKLILCSGRSKCAVKQLMEKFGFDGCVCSAGAYVEYHKQLVNKEIFEKATLLRLIDFMEQSGASYGLQCEEYAICPMESREECERIFGTGEESAENTCEGSEEKLDDIGKTFVFVEDIRAVDNVEKAFYYGANVGVEKVSELLGDEFDVRPASYNMPDANNGEVSINGITKSYGMQKLLEFLKVDKADMIAFGDGYNDMEMLEFAGKGVAMGNAVEELKKIADYVTDSVEQEGIYRAMRCLDVI
jgi:Cof subfamily protein (haloacid dehalogenase superfamily)